MGTHSHQGVVIATARMKVSCVFAAVVFSVVLCNVTGTIIVTSTAITGSTLAALAALKGAAVLGGLLGLKLGRGRRQAPVCGPVTDPETYLNLAVHTDHLGCTQRYVCEVHARDPADLSADETLIKNAFNAVSDADAVADDSFRYLYLRAAVIGEKGDVVSCEKEFNKCPLDSKTLTQEFEKSQL